MIFQANGNGKKAGVAILISDKIDFKPKRVTNKKQRMSLYNDKGINTSRRCNNCKYIQPQHLSTEIY